jgi:purine-binding chemotaxis protein CheW
MTMNESTSQFITDDATADVVLIDQYLTFTIASDHYGIPILNVQEIRGWEPVTRVPNTPHYLLGILNLRGVAVPVIDMRLRLGEYQQAYDPTTVMIILRSRIDGRERIAGIVVDSVSDVVNVDSDEVSQPPNFGAEQQNYFVQGLLDADGQMVMLFNVDEFMQHPDLYQRDELDE